MSEEQTSSSSEAPAPAPVALRQERQEWPTQAELEKLIAKLPAAELAWAYQSGLVIRELVNRRWQAGS